MVVDGELGQRRNGLPPLNDNELIEIWRQSSLIEPDGTVSFMEPMYRELLRPNVVPSVVWNEPRWRAGLENISRHRSSLRVNVCLSPHESRADFPAQFVDAIRGSNIVFGECFGWNSNDRNDGLAAAHSYMPRNLATADSFLGAKLHRVAQHQKPMLMADIDDGTQTNVSNYIRSASDMERMLQIGSDHPNDVDLHRRMRLSTYPYAYTLREWIMIAEGGRQLQELSADMRPPDNTLNVCHIVGSQHVGLLYKYRALGVSRIDYAVAKSDGLAGIQRTQPTLFEMAETGTIQISHLD